jgi:hypothetical protein
LSTQKEHGSSEDVKKAIDKSMGELLNVGDFVLYERHNSAMLARLVRREEGRYIIADVRTGEEVWVGAESLLTYGKPIDEWFYGCFHDHKDLFLPIYFATSLDEVVDNWYAARTKLNRTEPKARAWRLGTELKKSWVPKWGVAAKDEQDHWLRQPTELLTVVSWDKLSTPNRVLLANTDSLELSLATIRA